MSAYEVRTRFMRLCPKNLHGAWLSGRWRGTRILAGAGPRALGAPSGHQKMETKVNDGELVAPAPKSGSSLGHLC